MAKAKPQEPFVEIRFAEVPFREPRTAVSITQRRSQFDDALAVIKKGAGRLEYRKKPTRAIRMDGRSAEERRAVKSKLQTMGRKRGCVVEVLDDGKSVYAWATDRGSADRCFR